MGVAEKEADQKWMRQALKLAQSAQHHGEVPVGAVLVVDQQLIATAGNASISSHDPSAHAEIAVLRLAGTKMRNYRLPETTLYVTLEPCTMCAGALVHARIKQLVFGAYDLRTGAVSSKAQLLDQEHHNHTVSWRGGVLEAECKQLLQHFFQAKRS